MTSNAPTPSAAAVIGLGLMGRSIAACLLASGCPVIGVTDNLEASADAPGASAIYSPRRPAKASFPSPLTLS